MHINTKDILDRETGERAEFAIRDEKPDLPDISLAGGVSGSVTVTRLDDGLLADGHLVAELELECHRCLKAYTYPTQIKLAGRFSFAPDPSAEGEEWPISKQLEIDLAPLVRQELLLDLPIQLLCRPDCPGLCPECGQLSEPGHEH
ncbi:MAG TPA: YceD family protein [Candidatus Saccharimonadales bacterium]|nr:YceD family protein [Candidatus Saccharimonadales bacterium]